jgi:hypothetical protein
MLNCGGRSRRKSPTGVYQLCCSLIGAVERLLFTSTCVVMLLAVHGLLAFPHDRCLAVQFDDGVALFVGYLDEVLDRL